MAEGRSFEKFKELQVSEVGSVPKGGFFPKDGFVSNEETAIAIAVAILIPIYGKKNIDAQKPFSAKLKGNTWVVQGSFEKSTGVAEVDISKKSGEILRVIHGK
ncbi:NTF2 fold immunity protein [Pseudoduganella violacea]|uniref:NTF2 fold domain-containing protein n=1 Tax=Pseudoduganella violacea TaxID=1715466 RepID=A0A7W5FWS9_9BURK|nr:NTF2 fold immunity protein [Pseudoduganella violacea]MBB3121583.1 hypothetical protein [Pseudoduganella violacea]